MRLFVCVCRHVGFTQYRCVYRATPYHHRLITPVLQYSKLRLCVHASFTGVCIEPPRIITEYYPLGSLFSMLGQARDGEQRVIRSLSWPR